MGSSVYLIKYTGPHKLILIIKAPLLEYPDRSFIVSRIDAFQGNPSLIIKAPTYSKPVGVRSTRQLPGSQQSAAHLRIQRGAQGMVGYYLEALLT